MESEGRSISPSLSKVAMFISAISMGSVGLLVTVLSKFPVYTIVLLRGLFGTLFLSLFMAKQHSFRKKFLKETFKLHWKPLLLIAILNPTVIYLYFINIDLTGYAFAAFLLYTSGIFLLIFLIIFKLEKVSTINIISFLFAIAGVAVIMEFWNGNGFTMGIIVGLFSGITLALLTLNKKIIFLKREKLVNSITEEGDINLFMAWWATLFIIILFLPLGARDLVYLTWIDIGFSLILGLIPTALAFWLYNAGLINDKGGNIVIIAYFEPVMATILSIIFESITMFTIIGGLLILLANIIVLKYSK